MPFLGEVFEMLEVGMLALQFTLSDQNGQVHSLADYRGKKVIIKANE